jgi:phage terminase small subunit
MPGNHKKPSAIKLLEGNAGKRAIEASGIEALGGPFIAEHLCDDARGCIEVIVQSMPQRIYSALDSFALASFGMAWAIHKRAALEISGPRFEFIIPGSAGNQVVNPWMKVLNEQARIMAGIGDRLGLDPKSREALRLPGARQQKSEFDELIERKPSSTSSNSLQFPAARGREESSN